DLETTLTRARLQSLCGDLVARSLTMVEQSLHGLGLDPETVGQVVVTGGLTRVPMVRAAVAKLLGRALTEVVHPEEAVALGAAVQAGLIARKRHARPPATPPWSFTAENAENAENAGERKLRPLCVLCLSCGRPPLSSRAAGLAACGRRTRGARGGATGRPVFRLRAGPRPPPAGERSGPRPCMRPPPQRTARSPG